MVAACPRDVYDSDGRKRAEALRSRVMSATRINALVLVSPRAQDTLAFYRAVGIPLADEQHDEGPLHWACELGGAHIAVYATEDDAPAIPSWREAGSTLVGVEVEDLEVVVAALDARGAVMLRAPEDVPWGRRAVFADPDGRPVELNQIKDLA